jgi:hypothetical protein
VLLKGIKMRIFISLFAAIFCGILFSFSAQAATETALETVPFEGVQHECKQVGGIKFGANAQWANCHVTRGRWVATIDFLDMYQAQYCLGNTPESCEQRAQVLFANRAYTPDASVLLARLDEAGTTYSDPMVVNSGDDSVMGMGSHNAAGVAASRYYVWRSNHWLEMEAQHWQHDLQAALPKGTSSRLSALPDLETMSADVKLFKASDADCCPSGGVAKVAIGLASEVEKAQFTVKQVSIQP